MQGNVSEIARIRQQMELECQAMQLVMSGFTKSASHESIQNRYNALDKLTTQLEECIGDKTLAIETVIAVYDSIVK